MLFHFIDRTIRTPLIAKGKWVNFILISFIALWLTFQIFQTQNFVQASLEEGVVYYNHFNSLAYHESGFLQRLETFDFDEGIAIYSNDSAALYFFTGQRVKNSPSDSSNYVAAESSLDADAGDWPREEQAYFAWLRPNWKRHYFSPDQLSQIAKFENVLDDADGMLFLVEGR